MRLSSDSVTKLVDEWCRELPALDPSSLEVFGRISRLSAHISRRADRWLTPLGLTWETFSMIATLRRSGSPFQLRPGDLIRLSLLTSGAMTNRIDRVEELGLVERLRDPNDRRGVIVKLTDKGKVLAEEAIKTHFKEMSALLNPLPVKNRSLLTEALSQLLVSLEEDSAKPPGNVQSVERNSKAKIRKPQITDAPKRKDKPKTKT